MASITFTDVFSGSDGVLLSEMLQYCGINIFNMRIASSWTLQTFRRCIENDPDFWKRVNTITWMLSWDLYNPRMLTTFAGFKAIHHCWQASEKRIHNLQKSGLKIRFEYNEHSGLQGFHLTDKVGGMVVKSAIAAPIILRNDNRVWIKVHTMNIMNMRLMRETLLFLQPSDIRDFDFIPPDPDDEISSKNLACQFINYRIKSKLDTEKICGCSRCAGSVDNFADLIEQAEKISQIMQEGGILEFTGDMFTDFYDYDWDDFNLRIEILLYFIRHILSTNGNFPDKRRISILESVMLCVIDFDRAQRLTNDIYEVLARFRQSIGSPEQWKAFIARDDEECTGYITKWFANYANDKKWCE